MIEQIAFSKMHGLGNDFMVIDLVRQSLEPLRNSDIRELLSPERIKAWSDRHFGIGFDQLLIVEPPSKATNDFRYRIFNADGSEVEQCGNGARCFARFVKEQGLFSGDTVKVETASGDIVLHCQEQPEPSADTSWVRVDMGSPRLAIADVPFTSSDGPSAKGSYFIARDDQQGDAFVEVFVVSMGNPHAVLVVDNVDTAPVEALGPWLESHAQFPEKANIGFMQVLAPDEIRLRVYERGAGETLACGTGACAAVVAGVCQGLLHNSVKVMLPGGELLIEYEQQTSGKVMMTGPATTVFNAHIKL